MGLGMASKLTSGQQAGTPLFMIWPGGGKGFQPARQVALRQQSPGAKLGQKAHVTFGAVQLLGSVVDVVHWPVAELQEDPAGQQMAGWLLGCGHSCDCLQQVPLA